MLSFVVAGIGCALAALCYAEFAAMVPVAGSAYTYAYATLGELLAWIIGWDLVLEYAIASSTVAHGWSHYFVSFLGIFGITLPAACDRQPVRLRPGARGWVATGAIMNLPAVVVVLLVTVVLVIGIRESAGFNAAMVVLKLAVVLFVIVARRRPHRYRELASLHAVRRAGRSAGRRLRLLRLHRLRLGLAPTPRRRATRSATCRSASSSRWLLCTVLYILVAGVLTGMVPYADDQPRRAGGRRLRASGASTRRSS